MALNATGVWGQVCMAGELGCCDELQRLVLVSASGSFQGNSLGLPLGRVMQLLSCTLKSQASSEQGFLGFASGSTYVMRLQ